MLALSPARRMSSSRNAAARPVSSIIMDSAWSLACWMLRSRLFSLLIRMAKPTAFDPWVTTTGLPLRSNALLNPALVFTSQRGWLTKVATENATTRWRSALLAVPPHSMSMVPLAISGIRFEELTGWYCTARLGMESFCLMRSTMTRHRSIEMPMGFCSPSRYEKGMDDSRYPIAIDFASLILSRVWARASVATAVTAANVQQASAIRKAGVMVFSANAPQAWRREILIPARGTVSRDSRHNGNRM